MVEVAVMGRAGADLYPNQLETPLSKVRSFTRFAGGFAVNVATGLARLGAAVAIVSKVGNDGHGEFIREWLRGEGVDVRWLGTDPDHLTPLVFCEVFPPDHFPLLFYRSPTAPDWELRPGELDLDALGAIGFLVVSGTGLARSPSREATLAALEAAGGTAIFDLDWRPGLWLRPKEYEGVARAAMRHADVVVGNEAEVEAAVGASDADEAARRIGALGAEIVVVKRGAQGAVAFQGGQRWQAPGVRAEVVNGLGAGDAFLAALIGGMLRGLPLEESLLRANVAGALVAGQLACSAAMPAAKDIDAHRQTRAAGQAQGR
jgi:5-dehydro-2-deoxygluconokinase